MEQAIGRIEKGWKDNNSEETPQIVSFKDCPGETATTFMSLGLSDHILAISDTKSVRQELISSVYSKVPSSLIVSFLLSLCEAIMKRHKALLRGEVISLSKEVAKNIGFDSVYCAIPVFFDEAFSTYDEAIPPIVMVWILPIYQNEVDYIEANGWESFEELLEEKDSDLCALERESVV